MFANVRHKFLGDSSWPPGPKPRRRCCGCRGPGGAVTCRRGGICSWTCEPRASTVFESCSETIFPTLCQARLATCEAGATCGSSDPPCKSGSTRDGALRREGLPVTFLDPVATEPGSFCPGRPPSVTESGWDCRGLFHARSQREPACPSLQPVVSGGMDYMRPSISRRSRRHPDHEIGEHRQLAEGSLFGLCPDGPAQSRSSQAKRQQCPGKLRPCCRPPPGLSGKAQEPT